MERLFRELYTDYTELKGVNTMLVDEIKTYAEELEEKHAAEIKTYAEELEEKFTTELAERERQNKLDSALKLKAMDVPVDKIVKALSLPLEVVEKL
jgi:hypothetical protein